MTSVSILPPDACVDRLEFPVPRTPVAPDLTILAYRFWPDNYGGVESYLWNLATGLTAQGMRVHVIAENRTQSPPTDNPRPGLTIQRLPCMDAGRLWRWQQWVRLTWWWRVIRSAPAGKLWASEPISAAAAILAGRRDDLTFNPACCSAAMDMVGRRHPQATTLCSPPAQHMIDRFAYRNAPRVVLSSQNLRRQFRDFYGDHPHLCVVPHGVRAATVPTRAAARARWGLPGDAFVVGFVGRLDPCKGLEFLFEAFRRVCAADTRASLGARLLLAGEGPDRRRLERIAAELGVSDRITWTGKLANPFEAFSAMDVMVLPSVYEAFGNVLIEAMSVGVPVIGRRRDAAAPRPVLTACEELIDHGQNGFVVDPHDPADLAGRLATLAASPDLCSALGRVARAVSIYRKWDRVIAHDMAVLGLVPGHDMRLAA